MNITKRVLAATIIGGLLAGSLFSGIAFADPPADSNASCMGRESETNPPSGPVGPNPAPSEDSRPAVLKLFALVAGDDVKNLGGALSEFAHIDEDSHEECDATFVGNHS